MSPALKGLEDGDFGNLNRVIEDHGLEVRCHHCKTTSVQALGWLRDRQEMDCPDCEELIILDTVDLRRTIRTTTRQLRDFSEQLRAQGPFRT